jgi:hypothetical protein
MVRSRSFDRRFPTGGYYHADVPALRNVRIIAVNTNFFSTNYTNPCGKPGPDAGLRQLVWLDAELRLARDEGKRVWLLFHIPPGLDVYDTEECGGACRTQSRSRSGRTSTSRSTSRLPRRTATRSRARSPGTRTRTNSVSRAATSFTSAFDHAGVRQQSGVRDRRGDTARRGHDYVAHHLPNVTLPWAREYSWALAYAKPRSTRTLTQLEAAIAASRASARSTSPTFVGAPKSLAPRHCGWRGYWCGPDENGDRVLRVLLRRTLKIS